MMKRHFILHNDVASATLCWIDQQPKIEGITDGVVNVTAKAVLIKSNGGLLTVEGVDNGEALLSIQLME